MKYTQTFIPGVWIIEPVVYNDTRGYFFEAYKQPEFEQYAGAVNFMQDNESSSVRGVLRGLHYQLAPWSQAKLVRVIQGNVLDVVVDIRRGSPAFGKHLLIELSGENKRQLFIPKGFAHGFYVMSETAVFTYKVDNPYMPSHERSIRFNDPAIGIDMELFGEDTLIMSDKDGQAPLLADAEINFEYDK
jgi:dTDP-4-dehydrorhamnose 3,5-epimerase